MSDKYASLAPEAVARAYEQARARYAKPKEAEKAAKTALHQMTDAFMTARDLEKAALLAARYASGEQEALSEALLLHASTRERARDADALYRAIFAVTGEPRRVADLACGLNPLWLGSRGYAVRAADVHGGAVALVNDWARACGWDVEARRMDLLSAGELPEGDVALLFKLLPVLERQQKGAAMALLRRVNSPFAAVSFPTRSLGGRGVGMERSYSEWFEANLPAEFEILAREAFASELCYIVKRRAAAGKDGSCSTSSPRPSET